MVAFANNLNKDEALQNTAPHLRSNLYDIQLICQQNCQLNLWSIAHFEKRNYDQGCKEVKVNYESIKRLAGIC